MLSFSHVIATPLLLKGCFLSITWLRHLFTLIHTFFLSHDSDTFAIESVLSFYHVRAAPIKLRSPNTDQLPDKRTNGWPNKKANGWGNKNAYKSMVPNNKNLRDNDQSKRKKSAWGLAGVIPGIQSDLHDMIGKEKTKTKGLVSRISGTETQIDANRKMRVARSTQLKLLWMFLMT